MPRNPWKAGVSKYFAKENPHCRADMHGMLGFAACFAHFAGYFGSTDDRRVISFSNGFGVAMAMVAVAMGDNNICRRAMSVGQTLESSTLSVMNRSKRIIVDVGKLLNAGMTVVNFMITSAP